MYRLVASSMLAFADPPRARELRDRLVAYLAEIGDIHGERVKEALRSVPRHLFVPADESLDVAYANCPLPIGHGQTISQPTVVAVMADALELSGSERVLEIGTGSGYHAAVLSLLAREVYSVEIVPELAESSAARLRQLGCANVHVREGDGRLGWPEHAPFDRILATAAPVAVPQAWFEQLAEGGILVAPVGGGWGQSLLRYRKHRGETNREDLGPVAFVPCRGVEARGPVARRDAACVAFLQWALPRLQLRWQGFRKVRKLVCKRVLRRAHELGLQSFDDYREQLAVSPAEWSTLDALCRIPISRFYRDRAVFDALRSELLPVLSESALARGDTTLHAWSVGCASGEEPYTLSMIWRFDVARRFPSLDLRIVATDADEAMLERARRGCYAEGSLKLLPPDLRSSGFHEEPGLYRVRDEVRTDVTFLRQDVRATMPNGPFDLVLCRNVVFTYFEPSLQRTIAERIVGRMIDGGLLVVGCHERAPDLAALAPFAGARSVYERRRRDTQPPPPQAACPQPQGCCMGRPFSLAFSAQQSEQ
jgi:chemotaxis protein methyltransferase CheR